MVGPTDEVALFVPDLERGRRKDYEKTVDHWETILREKNVTRIKEVIPLNKVKTEFSQYEMKLKLGRMFDFFLVDGRITGHLCHLLGKTFRKSARPPTPVKLGRDNLKSVIENALKKTSLEIHGAGNSHSMQVASLRMDEVQIKENILAACENLKKAYPGGWENVRSIILKTAKGVGIPIYFSIRKYFFEFSPGNLTGSLIFFYVWSSNFWQFIGWEIFNWESLFFFSNLIWIYFVNSPIL